MPPRRCKVDYISRSSELPQILSYLKYDDVMACLRVNKRFNSTVNRNWNTMSRKEADLVIRKTSMSQIDVFFAKNNQLCTFTRGISVHPTFVTLPSSIKQFIVNQLFPNAVPFPNDGTDFNLAVNNMAEGVHVILRALLKRATFRRFMILAPEFSMSDEEIWAVRSTFQDYNVVKQKDCEVIFDLMTFHQSYTDIVNILGADAYKLELRDRDISRLNTEMHNIKLTIAFTDDHIKKVIHEWREHRRSIRCLTIQTIDAASTITSSLSRAFGTIPDKIDGRYTLTRSDGYTAQRLTVYPHYNTITLQEEVIM